MAYVITDACDACGLCLLACYPEAIIRDPKKFRIDPEKCTDCSVCLDACSAEAILPPTAQPKKEG